MRTKSMSIQFAAGFLIGSLSCLANVWHVNVANQQGRQDGKSWESAFTTIQPAIDAAHAAGGGEVWVAQGLYQEARSNEADGLNTGSLGLRSDVALYGGFAGNESSRDARDAAQHLTVISGKTARDGKMAYHVVIGADRSSMDGFTVQYGLSNAEHPIHRRGGGVLCTAIHMSITNCVIEQCGADHQGGGIYAEDSKLDITACVFRNNRCDYIKTDPESIGCGAGISFVHSREGMRIESSTFENNVAYGRGGGVYVWKTPVTITNSKFTSNSAAWGGGFAAYSDCNVSMTACTLSKNTADSGGAMRIAHRTPFEIAQCNFNENSSSGAGGGINFYFTGTGTMTDCSFINNRATSFVGGAMRLQSTTLRAARCQFKNNSAAAAGMAALAESSLSLDECTVSGNAPYAILGATETELLVATNSRFGENGNGLYRVGPTNRVFGSVEQLAAAFPEWKGNRSTAPAARPPSTQPPAPPSREIAQLAPAAASNSSAPLPSALQATPLPTADETIPTNTIAIKTEDTSFTISGSYAIAAIITIVFILGVFSLVLVARFGMASQERIRFVLPDEPNEKHTPSR